MRKQTPWKSRVEEGDMKDVLRELAPAVRFDVVVADPPYNIGKDFGAETEKLPIGEYVEWLYERLGACRARLAVGGVLYVYGFPEILARVAVRYEIEEQRWLVWHYTNKAVPASRFWQRSHEAILCLWGEGQRRPPLEVDQIREAYTPGYLRNAAGKVRAATESRFGGTRGRETTFQAHSLGALPRDVLKVPALAGGAGRAERWFLCRDCEGKVFPPSARRQHRDHDMLKHPTQKPAELTRRLLLSRAKPSDGRVLVPFAGSGSECAVAKELGLDFLGIEINPQYVDFARQRLEQTKRLGA